MHSAKKEKLLKVYLKTRRFYSLNYIISLRGQGELLPKAMKKNNNIGNSAWRVYSKQTHFFYPQYSDSLK